MGVIANLNADIGATAVMVAARSRHLAVNNPYASNGINNLVGSAVGTGIRPTPRHPDPNVCAALVAAWDRWNERADLAGRTSFDGLQADIMRSVVVDGEAFPRLLHDEEGELKVQQLPAEQIDRTKIRNLDGGGVIAWGVQLDAFGRRVAYFVRPYLVDDIRGVWAESIRVPADDILHVMRALSPGQVRGVSWLASIILTAADLDTLLDAVLMGAKTRAMICAIVTDETDLTPADPLAPEPSLEPGAILRFGGGKKLTPFDPAPATETAAFVRLNLQALAAGLGLPTHMLDGDMSNQNYSSGRMGLLPFRVRVEQVQYGTLVPQLLNPVYRRFVLTEILQGRLDAPDFENNRESYFAVDWIMPRPLQVDPEKEVKATVAEISAGLTSRRKAVAERGWPIEDLDAEIQSDREREAALGLDFRTKPTATETEVVASDPKTGRIQKTRTIEV